MRESTNPDLHRDYAALVKARPDYERAEEFYCGKVEEEYSSVAVARLLRRFNLDNLPTFNFAHIAVDAITDMLHLNSVTTEDNTLDVVLDDLNDLNDLNEEFPILLLNACKYGDAYLMVWPSSDAEGNPVGVTMRCKDPLTVRVFYGEEDPTHKARAIQSWEEGAKAELVVRANLYYPDRVERYVHQGKVPQDPKRAKWQPYTGDDAPAVVPNPFGEVPFFHYRTARPYGVPLHVNAYGPQLAINKLISSHLATVDYQSFPQRYALVDPAADLSGPQSNDFDEEHPLDGEDPETAGQSQLDASPNALWNLQGYKEVGQFEAADPRNFLAPLDRYIKALAQVTGIPMHAFDSTGDAISGESRREANEPIYDRVEHLQESFGATHRRAYQFALQILGEDADVSVTWKPARRIDDKEGWETIKLKIELGIPKDVVFAEAGYLASDIDAWLAAAGEQANTAQDSAQPKQVPQSEDDTRELNNEPAA
jgi:hypothetical protein